MRDINVGDKVSYRDASSLKDVVGTIELVSTINKCTDERLVGKEVVSINVGPGYALIFKLSEDISILEYANKS